MLPEDIDPITFEVIRNGLDTLVDEMALTVMRTAHSGVVKDAMDYSTAFCDRNGEVVAQGLTIVCHLGSFPAAVASVIDKYGDTMVEGDMFILNDPYTSGGIHLPDIYVIQPVFVDGEPEGFAGVVAHHTDVGGIVPGSNSTDSTEIYQEGLRIPTLRLYDRGEPVEAVFTILAANVRVPDKVLGDLRAQIAAAHTGKRGLVRLTDRYGAASVRRYMDVLIDHSEHLAREEIEALPDGTYHATGYIDADNVPDGPLVLQVAVTIDGDRVVVDFEGSSSQMKAGINSPVPFTKAAVYGALRLLMDPGIPNSAGYTRLIEVRTPLASVVNPVLPAACGARGITGFRIMDTVLAALAQAVPDKVPADGEGGNTIISIGGHAATGGFAYVDLFAGARGARPTGDGPDGVAHPAAKYLEHARRDRRGRVAREDRGVRPASRLRRRGQIPGRTLRGQERSLSGRRGPAAAPLRQARPPALRAAGRRTRRPVVQHPQPRRGPAGPDHNGHGAHAQGRPDPPRACQRRGLGRPSGPRPGDGPGRLPGREGHSRPRPPGLRRRHRPGHTAGRHRRDGATARRAALAPPRHTGGRRYPAPAIRIG